MLTVCTPGVLKYHQRQNLVPSNTKLPQLGVINITWKSIVGLTDKDVKITIVKLK